MELHEYPRPANDTGIGVHWTVGYASAIGIGKIRDYWIPEMKAMGIKWVKIFNHDGAIDFAELLLAEGFMPVVRIFRPSPNPGTLDIRDLVHLDALIRVGVRYFEFNSEPEQDSEWKGGRVPANGLDLVAENAIANMDTILERGGMPAVPAVSSGSRWDLVGKIVALGRKDLFNGPVWQAIHNYAQNRPLDYPYDIGNQEGAAYTQRFYETIADERWGEDAWRGRGLTEVNRLRAERCNPGTSIMDDRECWLAYEYFDARNRHHIGRSIPLLSTEGGYLVGEDVDPRYPATTPDLHMAQSLEACRIMMGTSSRFEAAPDYFFCTAFWLLGNAVLGSTSNWCEQHAWYSERWPGGALPIVHALKAEPKEVRHWENDAPIGARAKLQGTVAHAADHRTLILERDNKEVTRTTLDANSRYVLADLIPGTYTLRVDGTAVAQTVRLQPGQETAIVNIDLAEEPQGVSSSKIVGSVRGGAGAVVLLLRASDGEEWVTMARDDGSFRFVDLQAGLYNVRIQGNGSRVDGVRVDGQDQQEVELAVAGWGYTVHKVDVPDRVGAIRCAVEGYKDLAIYAQTAEWRSEPVRTGDMPDIGPYACEISPLEPGYYAVVVEGLVDDASEPVTLEAYVHVDRRQIPHVDFVYTDVEELQVRYNSSIRGRVIGGCEPDSRLFVWLIDEQARRREQQVEEDCTFLFTDLGPGLYSVEIAGQADVVGRSDIALDGNNSVDIELRIPVEQFAGPENVIDGRSVIAGEAPDTAGRTAKLVDAVGNEYRQAVDAEHRFRFEHLEAGEYTLTIDGGYEQGGLTVDGSDGLEVIFQPLVATWQAKVSPAGSMPGYSVLRVEVEGMRGLPVYIWKEDWEGMMRRTGSKPEYGECAAEFSPLGPGHYMVEPEGLGMWADVELTGLEVVWIDFRRIAVPENPHVVQKLDLPSDGIADAEVADDDAWAEEELWDDEEGGGPFAPDMAQRSALTDEAASLERSEVEEADVVLDLRATEDMENTEDMDGSALSALQGEQVDTGEMGERIYLFVLGAIPDRDDLVALMRYVSQHRIAVGSDLGEAQNASHVILVGEARPQWVAEVTSQLEAQGAIVEYISEHIAETFAARLHTDI